MSLNHRPAFSDTRDRPVLSFIPIFLILCTALAPIEAEGPKHHVHKELYGKLPDGTEVELYTLTNGLGLEARIMSLGATLTTVRAPDRQGKQDILTLHKNSFEEYVGGHPLFGSVVGRFANRIANARFRLDGKEYQLDANAGKHQLHGGKKGFQWLPWSAEPVRETGAVGVKLTLVSPNGQGGFPGTLRATVIYKVTGDNQLVMEYTATADQPTHVNLTNHAYWNLAGAGAPDHLGHVLLLNADHYLPTDPTLIPTGEIRKVKNTPLDFTQPRAIGSRVREVPMKHYDHCFVLNKKAGERLSLAARVAEPKSGRVMEVWTTQPGVQFYTGNLRGFCLETQHYPDSPNQPSFPSTVLRPGETYHEITVHKFNVEKKQPR